MKSLITTALLGIVFASCGTKDPIFSTNEGAIKGYDAVAYFTEGAPVKGNQKYSCEWMDATWFFSSKENQVLFESDPFKYAPQFGGYCAYGIAMGSYAKIEPEAWKIVDGKLYLNYNSDIQQEWEANQQNFIAQAESNWENMKKR